MRNRTEVEIRLGSPDTERQMAQGTPISGMSWLESRTLFPTKEFSGLRVLDVGAGLSDIVAILSKRAASAFAIDPVYRDLARLREKSLGYLANSRRRYLDYESMNEKRASVRRFWDSIANNPDHYIAAYATKLPFRDRAFDIVYSNGAIFPYLATDWQTVRSAINECIRVTKPGGTISISPYEGHASPDNELEAVRHPNERRLVALLQGDNQVTYEIKKIPFGNWSGHRTLFVHKKRNR